MNPLFTGKLCQHDNSCLHMHPANTNTETIKNILRIETLSSTTPLLFPTWTLLATCIPYQINTLFSWTCPNEHIVNMITSQHDLLVVGVVDMRWGLLHQERGLLKKEDPDRVRGPKRVLVVDDLGDEGVDDVLGVVLIWGGVGRPPIISLALLEGVLEIFNQNVL